MGCDVILSDSVTSPNCINNCKEAVKLNNLENNVQVQHLLFLDTLTFWELKGASAASQRWRKYNSLYHPSIC